MPFEAWRVAELLLPRGRVATGDEPPAEFWDRTGTRCCCVSMAEGHPELRRPIERADCPTVLASSTAPTPTGAGTAVLIGGTRHRCR